MSCMAVIRPLSPTTYAEPAGRCSWRKSAVASAEVKMRSSGTSIPLPSSRARRSRRVKIELLVISRYFNPLAPSAPMNSEAPSIGSSSCTSTPSMSVSQVWTGRCSLMPPLSVMECGLVAIPGPPGMPALLRGCTGREATRVTSRCDEWGAWGDAQHRLDARDGRLRAAEIGPGDPDATPAGELGDPGFALLLAKYGVDH